MRIWPIDKNAVVNYLYEILVSKKLVGLRMKIICFYRMHYKSHEIIAIFMHY
jgi:hypothetical protein